MALDALFDYDGSGVMPGRTWVIAPDKASLEARWDKLVAEPDAARKAELFHPHLRDGKPGDKHAAKEVKEGLFGRAHRSLAVAKDSGPVVPPERYGFRSFDRQWIIPDARLLNQPNPTLWKTHSPRQVYATAPHDRAPSNGPALTFTALIPDLHHYANRGGRVIPLWADAKGTKPNIRAAVLVGLSDTFGRPVKADELFAYIAAVAAHPAYTARFAADLRQPGLRIPIAADAALFTEAAALGREVVWLHTFGERFGEGRPPGPPRVEDGPTVPKGAELSTDDEPMPDTLSYDAAARRLRVGGGYVANVGPQVWTYEVSGKTVLKQWFGYRRLDRSKPPMGDRRPPSPLGEIQPEAWPADYTSELIRLLHVLTLLVRLEPAQADLLQRIVDSPTLDMQTGQ